MKKISFAFPSLLVACLLAVGTAHADDASNKDAGRHFDRGVELFGEADYRGALVEFQRAYQIAPNAAVLYNVGETQYQLQNYAAAMISLERYMSGAGANASHRAEVQQTLDVLAKRVGKIAVTTNVPGADIAVDDEAVGITPLAEPTLASVGHRRVTATVAGKPPASKYVDVTAGDTVPVSLVIGEAPAATATTATTADQAPPKQKNTALETGLWIGSGALGAGAIATGIVALSASHSLSDDRSTYPTSRSQLDSDHSRARTFAILADSLGGASIIAGGLALYIMLKPASESSKSTVQAAVTGNGLRFSGAF